MPGGPSAAPEPPSPIDGRTYAVRVALFYAALFLIYGVHLPYLPVWLDWRGLGANEIAAIMSAPFFLRLVVTPAVAAAADMGNSHRAIVIGLSWACVTFAVLLSQVSPFWPVFLAAVSFHISSSTIMPLTETVAVRGVRAANLDYGRMRLWGSLTFIAIGVAGGSMMDAMGPRAALWLLLAGAVATAGAAHLLPRPAPRTQEDKSRQRGPIGRDALRLVRSRLFLVFLLAVGLSQATHGTFYTFGALHWRSQEISTAMIGALWAVAVLAEVALFAYSNAVLKVLGPVALIIAGSAAGVVRWGAMAFDPPMWALMPLQALHALTYGATHLGAIHFIGRAVPEGASGTAQALYATFAAGVFMGVVTLASGPIYTSFGGLTYLMPALIAAVGLALGLALQRGWAGGALWSSEDKTG